MDQKKSPNRRSKRQTKVAEDSFWDCSVCTYRNTAEAFKCLMCDVRKGTSTRKPRINPQLVAQQVAQQYNQPTPKSKRDGLPPGSKADPGSPGGSTAGDGRSMDSADVHMGGSGAELSGGDGEGRPSSKSERRVAATSPVEAEKPVPPAVVLATGGLAGTPIGPRFPAGAISKSVGTTPATPSEPAVAKKGHDAVRTGSAGAKAESSKSAGGSSKSSGGGSKAVGGSAKAAGGTKAAAGSVKVAGTGSKVVGASGGTPAGRVTVGELSRSGGTQASPGGAPAKGAGGGAAARGGGGAGAVTLGFAGVAAAPVAGNGIGMNMAAPASDFPAVAAMDFASLRAGGGVATAAAAATVNVGAGVAAGAARPSPPTLNHFPPPPSLRAEKKNGNNAMHSDGKPSRKARRLTYPSRPKLKNVDRTNAQVNSVTVNNVTVIITEFQPKRHQPSSAASADHHPTHNHHLGHSSPAAAATAAATGLGGGGGGAHGPHAASNNTNNSSSSGGHHRNGAASGQQQNGNHSDSTNLSTDSHSDGRSS